MCRLAGFAAMALAVIGWPPSAPAVGSHFDPSGCLACHEGIEPIREPESEMLRVINELGVTMGDPEGCIICHGGDAEARTEEDAHGGRFFYADPGSPWVNRSTCGKCHADHVRAQWYSPMMTESGKIQGTSWSFGALQGYDHVWANYDARNPERPNERLGTADYRAYMADLAAKEPGAFPDEQKTMPEAPTNLSQLAEHPELAGFTYHRAECQRCHLGVKGRDKRGDYRGMGCSACHMPYGNEGLYEGGDPTIPKDEPGHLLVHMIQSTRQAKVALGGKTYSGIPVETCTTCHDRGKRIGVSFQGLMESAFHSPYQASGEGQVDLHIKHYIAMHQDIHSTEGMMCLDCHTSIDVHGDGFIAGTNLAMVQIECTDCHGTPSAYPWELPLGYGDEFGTPPRIGEARGVATDLNARLSQGTLYAPEDGYLRTARGNPFPEVVRRGDRVIVHTAGGKDLELTPLKTLASDDSLGREPRVAMVAIHKHIDKMECYTCHAVWIPQCYGCHLKIDYSNSLRSFDWVAAGHMHAEPEHAADRGEAGYDTYLHGKVSEQRSYMRWEEPPMAVNGEGRICTCTTGCQPCVTIIGPNGETILHNHIFRTPPGLEGSGSEGQLTLDMTPGQPHTTGRARSCESCHMLEKALGYGIGGGAYTRPWDEPITVDLMTAGGEILSEHARPQMEGIPGLRADWSQFVTPDGEQLMTVGHHWTGSRPMNDAERANTDRRGLCLACHQEIPTESLAVSLLHHAAAYAGALPKTNEQHASLVHKILLFSAWGQAGGAVGTPAVALVIVVWLIARKRRRTRPSESADREAGPQGPSDRKR
ncbi:MAG: hypothetical protein JSU68_14240 [Phycisphaerales bacterium]|nr:MAG: hypothetical protein JSU68_14240 [Phycisphaerales bacterium]